MDCEASVVHNLLERMIVDESIEPTGLPLALLKAITNNFSDNQQIGRGGFAVVYKVHIIFVSLNLLQSWSQLIDVKAHACLHGNVLWLQGQLQGGRVAVKRLSPELDMDEKNFKHEISSLIKVKHKNIVRFLGYCSDTQGRVETYEGRTVMAHVRERLLCFEFLPNGSLDWYITGMSVSILYFDEWGPYAPFRSGRLFGLWYCSYSIPLFFSWTDEQMHLVDSNGGYAIK